MSFYTLHNKVYPRHTSVIIHFLNVNILVKQNGFVVFKNENKLDI